MARGVVSGLMTGGIRDQWHFNTKSGTCRGKNSSSDPLAKCWAHRRGRASPPFRSPAQVSQNQRHRQHRPVSVAQPPSQARRLGPSTTGGRGGSQVKAQR